MEIILQTIITISTVLFHTLSLTLLFLIVSAMIKEDKTRTSAINKGGGTDNDDAESPS